MVEKLLNQNYHDPEIYNILGQIASQKGDLAEAEKWLQAGMVKFPNNIAGLLLLGKLYRTQHRTLLGHALILGNPQLYSNKSRLERLFYKFSCSTVHSVERGLSHEP